MGFSAPPPSSPLSSRGVEDMSHQRPTCHNPSMRRERDRLDSFHPWTLSIITPAELAKAGFYYLGQGDRVACFSCGGQVCIIPGTQVKCVKFCMAKMKFEVFVCICSWVTGSQATELYLNTRGIIQTVALCGGTEPTTCRWPRLLELCLEE